MGPGAAAEPVDGATLPDFVRIQGDSFVVNEQPFVMHGFNYSPRDYAWSAMTDWDWGEVDQELALAQDLGGNTIRVVIDYGFSTGHPNENWTSGDLTRASHPTPDYLAAMDRLLTIANQHGIRVVFSLFDFMPGWAFIDQAQYGPATTYATDLVSHFANDSRIAAWDILNEGDMFPEKFSTTSLSSVLNFYAAMSAAIRAADHQHLVTADFGNIDRAYLSQEFVDYVSFHYYADQARLPQAIDDLRGKLRKPMPIVAGELGAPSAGNQWASLSAHTVALGAYLDSTLQARNLAGALVWTLVDHNRPRTANTRAGQMEPLDFGIFNRNLEPKPSADIVRRYFSGQCAANRRIELHFPPVSAASAVGDSRSLAIGLHQLALLGADGTPLDRIAFGTIEADVLDGRGWYANEAWGQWAGSADGTATLCLAVPPGTASVSLSAHAIQPGTQVQVWADGTQLGTITLQPTEADYQLPII